MASLLKCCVGNCKSTNSTHKLYSIPMNDNLRKLWMSLLVPTNPSLLWLTKRQLMSKRVCSKHFDRTQFDVNGVRLRYSYPCLLTEKEIFHGIPLPSEDKILKVPKESLKTTAEVVELFNDLFDSVNGSPGAIKGSLKNAVKPNSPHQEFWQNCIRKIDDIRFIDKNSKLAIHAGKPRYVRVPCLEGWKITLKSFIGLAKLLFNKYKVDYFYPRFINREIYIYICRNTNPDPKAFIYSFKSLTISSILSPHSKFANCEKDEGEGIIDFNYLFFNENDDTENVFNNEPTPLPLPIKLGPVATLPMAVPQTTKVVTSERVKVQISAYTAGYVCRKLTKKINCKACTSTYVTKEYQPQGIHQFLKYREFKRLKNNNLAYPTEKFLILYRDVSELIYNYLDEKCNTENIMKNLKRHILDKNITWLGCKSHRYTLHNYFSSLVVRLHCHSWCGRINKILYGKIEEKFVSHMGKIAMMAQTNHKKYKLRKKKLNK